MPLILAIEPDKKQASQLTAIVRGRLHAELILGESAERALAALGPRVPDLILTSALLSPKDESALGERLRALNGAAAHVQTLTTPVLATSHGRGLVSGRAGSVLSALRREKPSSDAPAGCDPAVFAEQCREYLERAETDRASKAERELDAEIDHQPVQSAPVEEHIETETEAVVLAAPQLDVPTEEAEIDFTTPPVDAVDTPMTMTPDAQPELRQFFTLPADEEEGPASLLAAVAALAAEEAAAMAAQAPRQPTAVEPEAAPVYELDAATVAEFESVPSIDAQSESVDATLSETELYSALPAVETVRWPTLAVAADAPPPPAAASEPDETKEWLDIIEALRRDAAQVPLPAPMPTPAPAPAPAPTPALTIPAPAVAREEPAAEPAGRLRRRASAEDEWGIFDPEQCGFQALLAKLEKITEENDAQTKRA
jgi:hypothetical protein